MFHEWKEGQYVDFVRNESYWGNKSQIENARIVFCADDNTRINMLKAGEVDMISNVPWNTIDTLSRNGFTLSKVPQALSVAATFDLINNNAPWSDVRVRQAINYCIDRDGVVEKLCYNVPEKIEWLCDWELGFQPGLKNSYPYDLQKAKTLMLEAGYPEGFSMPIIYTAGATGLKTIVEYISDSLKSIDIQCKITALNHGPEFFGKIRELHDDPKENAVVIWEIGGPGNADPVLNLTSQYYSGKSSGLYSTQELDTIVEKALSTVEVDERGGLIKEAYRIIDNDLPVIHFFKTVYVFASNERIKYTPSNGALCTYSILADTMLN
jgi:peptide/nickel transport system substrate-binding protein